jgi:hypothetical protein
MIGQTADAGRTPTRRNPPHRNLPARHRPLLRCSHPVGNPARRGGAAAATVGQADDRGQRPGGSVAGAGVRRGYGSPLPPPLGSFTAFAQNPIGEVRVAGCDLNSDGTDDVIARDVPRCRHRSAPYLTFNQSFRGWGAAGRGV